MASWVPGISMRENGHRQLRLQRDVLGDVEREGGLAHRGPAGDDDHVARLQAGSLHVEVVEAGRDAGDIRRMLAVVELLDAVDHLRQQAAGSA